MLPSPAQLSPPSLTACPSFHLFLSSVPLSPLSLCSFFRKAGDTRAQFLAQGAAALRFEGEWVEADAPEPTAADRAAAAAAAAAGRRPPQMPSVGLPPERRRFALQYYLADDTAELLELPPVGASTGGAAGSTVGSKFLARQRLPRMPLEARCAEAMLLVSHPSLLTAGAVPGSGGAILPPAEAVEAFAAAARARYAPSKGATQRAKFVSPITGRPAFSTVGSSTAATLDGGSGHGDRDGSAGASAAGASAGAASARVRGVPVLTSQASEPEYVTAADLICGGVVSIYGRPLLLRSCDAFAVAFALHSFGFDQRDVFVREAPAPVPPPARIPLPPHAGALAVGVEEETRMNANKLIPTYRRERDAARAYQLGAKALRFAAKLDPARCDPEDARRRFVVSFYLEDCTMSIGELTGARTGHGPSVVRWLQRGRYRNATAPPDEAVMEALGVRPAAGGAAGGAAGHGAPTYGVAGSGISSSSSAGAGAGGFTPLGLPPAVAAAYDRIYGASRDKVGYTESSGAQGYGGGIYGKAERVGAGGVGVESAADIGVRDAALHALRPIPRFFAESDFYPGASLALEHTPGLRFLLGAPDAWTSAFLAARAAAPPGTDPKDVFVPENSSPVPALPLEAAAEAASGDAAGGPGSAAAATMSPAQELLQLDSLAVAKILTGVSASARLTLKQADKLGRGYAPRAVVAEALARYGVMPPACAPGVVDRLLDAYTIDFAAVRREIAEREAALASGGFAALAVAHAAAAAAAGGAGGRSGPAGGSPVEPAGGKRYPRTPAGTGGVCDVTDPRDIPLPPSAAAMRRPTTAPGAGRAMGTVSDPLSGPFLTDFAGAAFADVPMVDYPALFDGLAATAARQTALQPRMDKLMSQLRAALLSSRTHLRRVFRDLDVAGCGAITAAEFRHMLRRHNLDIGISDAQLRALMRRFPSAPADVREALREPTAISWDGFVRALLEVETLSREELDHFLAFVRGLRDCAPDGVGTTRAVPGMGGAGSSDPAVQAKPAGWAQPASAADPSPFLRAVADAGGVGVGSHDGAHGAGAGAGAMPRGFGFGAVLEARLMPGGAAAVAAHPPALPPRPHTAPAPPAAAAAPVALDARRAAVSGAAQRPHTTGSAAAVGAGAGGGGGGSVASSGGSGSGSGRDREDVYGYGGYEGYEGFEEAAFDGYGAAQAAAAAPGARAGPPGSSPGEAAPSSKTAPRTVHFASKAAVAPPAAPSSAGAGAGGLAAAMGAVSTFLKPSRGVPTIDAVAALSRGGPECTRVLGAVRRAFAARRFDLYRALSLYDTGRTSALDVPSFVAALTSAGLRVTRAELSCLKAALLRAHADAHLGGGGARASGAGSGAGEKLPSEADVFVDYASFFDTLWSSDGAGEAAAEAAHAAPAAPHSFSGGVRPATAAY